MATSCKQRGIFRSDNSAKSLYQFTTLLLTVSGSGSSQSHPSIHMSWISIRACTVYGVMKPSGSNTLAVALRKDRLVILDSRETRGLNVKLSVVADHSNPSVFTLGNSGQSRSIWLARSSFGTLHHNFRVRKPFSCMHSCTLPAP